MNRLAGCVFDYMGQLLPPLFDLIPLPMNADAHQTIILFAGFNEVGIPKRAQLLSIEANGYEVSLVFRTEPGQQQVYRQFYVAFNSGPIDYTQGILRLLKKIDFADGTSTAMIYEVYPYDEEQTD